MSAGGRGHAPDVTHSAPETRSAGGRSGAGGRAAPDHTATSQPRPAGPSLAPRLREAPGRPWSRRSATSMRLPVSAAAMKYRRCRSSIGSHASEICPPLGKYSSGPQ